MRQDTRGQSTIDYAIGVSLFLMAVLFIFMFVPSLFQPFTGTQNKVIVTDRAANQLVEDTLIQDDNPQRSVLDRECTQLFFEQMNGANPAHPDDCRFNETTNSINVILGLQDIHDVNVTIEGSSESSGIVTLDGTTLKTGDESPEQGDVVASQRVVHIVDENGNAQEYRLFVRVW